MTAKADALARAVAIDRTPGGGRKQLRTLRALAELLQV